MPLKGLRWGRNRGSANCDLPQGAVFGRPGGGGTIVALLVVGEVALRVFLGMCDAPLYEASKKWEYMACPNQDGYRFGNHYHYNSYR